MYVVPTSVAAMLQLPLVRQQLHQLLRRGTLHPGHPLDDVVEVFPGVDLLRLACGNKRADDGHVLRSFVAATEEVVLASECDGTDGILHEVLCKQKRPEVERLSILILPSSR